MTRVDVRNRVLEELESNSTYFSQTDLNNAIQDCYDEIAVGAGLIEKKAHIAAQNNTVYYALSTLISDYYRVTGIFYSASQSWLNVRDRHWLAGLRRDWELMTGGPKFYSVIDMKMVAITPYMPVATGTFTVHYKAIAPTLTETASIMVPTEHEKIMDHYCLADAQEQAREFMKAQINAGQYEEFYLKLKNKMASLGKPARRYELWRSGRMHI